MFLRTEIVGDGLFVTHRDSSFLFVSHLMVNQSVHPSSSSSSRHVNLKFKRCLTEVFVKSSRTASRDRSIWNKIPLVNFGLEILSQSGLEAVANDKGGGYSLVDPEVLTDIHLQMFGNGQYFDTDFTNWKRLCAKSFDVILHLV